MSTCYLKGALLIWADSCGIGAPKIKPKLRAKKWSFVGIDCISPPAVNDRKTKYRLNEPKPHLLKFLEFEILGVDMSVARAPFEFSEIENKVPAHSNPILLTTLLS